MADYTLEILDDVYLEIETYFDWFNERKLELGDEFVEELDEYLRYLWSYPLHYQITSKGFRQAVLKRFPYVIIYKVYGLRIIVFSVFPTRDNPDKKPK